MHALSTRPICAGQLPGERQRFRVLGASRTYTTSHSWVEVSYAGGLPHALDVWVIHLLHRAPDAGYVMPRGCGVMAPHTAACHACQYRQAPGAPGLSEQKGSLPGAVSGLFVGYHHATRLPWTRSGSRQHAELGHGPAQALSRGA